MAYSRGLYQAGRARDAIAGFPCHWAYISGNSRLSCSMCVLASAGDVFNGAMLNPWTWAELALMEVIGGWGFQQGRWLASLSKEVLALSFRRREHLHGVLRDLGLVRLQARFSLCLLLGVPSLCVAFWSVAAFVHIARVIADYWNSGQAGQQG